MPRLARLWHVVVTVTGAGHGARHGLIVLLLRSAECARDSSNQHRVPGAPRRSSSRADDLPSAGYI